MEGDRADEGEAQAGALWLALYLPRWPLEVFADRPPAGLLVHDGGHRPRVVAADAVLQAAGVRPGMPLAAARAFCPQAVVRQRRRRREQQRLERLATWAGQFTSWVVLEPPQSVLLEVRGSCRLFGGLETLLGRIEAGVSALGVTARLALAPTPLAATWLARAGQAARLTAPARLPRALSRLPMEVLALAPAAEARLRGMGLECIGDLLRLPRDGLARRLDPEITERLDRALGRRPDPRRPFEPPPRFRARQDLALPTGDMEALQPVVLRLLEELCGWLRGRGAAVRAMRLEWLHHRRPATVLALDLPRGLASVEDLRPLVEARCARVVLPAAVTGVVIESRVLEPLAPPVADLFGQGRRRPLDPMLLVERLRARLGTGAVRGLALREDHRPERAWAWCEPGTASEDAWLRWGLPLWLLSVPRALPSRDGRPWYRGRLRLWPARSRIESGWWDDEGVRRDYFTAEDGAGNRYWVFRTPAGDWFLHGIFG